MNSYVMLAGKGELPWIAAANILKAGHQLAVFCLTDHSPPKKYQRYCQRVHITRFYTDVLAKLKKIRPEKLLMLGKITRDLIYHEPVFDRKTQKLIASLSSQSDYELFTVVAKLIEKNRIQIIPQNIYLPNNFLPVGCYGKSLDNRLLHDAKIGCTYSYLLNRLAIGQSVVVGQGAVQALEASEGTNACIRRGGKIFGKGAVVCKLAKPTHDIRFDMPTVGIKTLRTMAKFLYRALVIDSKRTIVVKPQNFIKTAESFGISVLSVPSANLSIPNLRKVNRIHP